MRGFDGVWVLSVAGCSGPAGKLFSQTYDAEGGRWRFRRLIGTRSAAAASLRSIRFTLDREDPVMTRSISRRLLLAGATATALLTLGVFSGSAGASAAPATTASASAVDSGSLSAAAIHSLDFYINGVFSEYLANVDVNGNYLYATRGGSHGAAFEHWLDVNRAVRTPATISYVVRDWENLPYATYTFYGAFPVKVASNTLVTIYFARYSVSYP